MRYIPSSRDKFMVEMSWAGPWARPWVIVSRPMGHVKTSSCFCLKFNLRLVHWFLQTISVDCFVYRVMSHLKKWVTHVFQYHKTAHEPPWVGTWVSSWAISKMCQFKYGTLLEIFSKVNDNVNYFFYLVIKHSTAINTNVAIGNTLYQTWMVE